MKKLFVISLLSYFYVQAAIPPAVDVFSEKVPFEQRWKKYHDYILKRPHKAQEMALKALKSNDWFMREAGLKTLVTVNPERAKAEARLILQKDPAMLVRASAVTALKILKDTKSESVLWESLKDPRNFRKDQSLWIRPQIMATLIEFKAVQKENYKNFYEDKDPQVVRLAKHATR